MKVEKKVFYVGMIRTTDCGKDIFMKFEYKGHRTYTGCINSIKEEINRRKGKSEVVEYKVIKIEEELLERVVL